MSRVLLGCSRAYIEQGDPARARQALEQLEGSASVFQIQEAKTQSDLITRLEKSAATAK